MDIKQNNEDQPVNWEYIPNINTISQYLNGSSLMELSKCCKRYRNQIESRIFEEVRPDLWFENNKENYGIKPYEFEKVLEFIKTDLGSKLRFVKNIDLSLQVDCECAEMFVEIFPNIKSLSIDLSFNYTNFYSGDNLEIILKGLKGLEHLSIEYGYDAFNYISNDQIFPKSLKSLYIWDYEPSYETNDYIHAYETIDASYTNLYSLSIISNRALQNLSSGMQNLQEVDIDIVDTLDKTKLVAFLKANPQLRKLDGRYNSCNEVIIKTVLSSKYLEHYSVYNWDWKEVEFNDLPSNYSIKYLYIRGKMPAPLAMQLISACKRLETLDCYTYDPNLLDYSKFERRVNKLNLGICSLTSDAIKKIDDSMMFNLVHINDSSANKNFDKDCGIDKLRNYRYIPPIYGARILELINKND